MRAGQDGPGLKMFLGENLKEKSEKITRLPIIMEGNPEWKLGLR